MSKRQAPTSGNHSLNADASLDAGMTVDDSDHSGSQFRVTYPQETTSKPKVSSQKSKQGSTKKKLILVFLGSVFALVLWESSFVQADFVDKFLEWVEQNPVLGLGAILVVIAVAVVTLLPVGTPLTIACGYIYRGVYGWRLGLFFLMVRRPARSTRSVSSTKKITCGLPTLTAIGFSSSAHPTGMFAVSIA